MEYKQKTPIPKDILEQIVKTLGFNLNSEKSGPDEKSNHKTLKGLERTAIKMLGKDVSTWEKILSNKRLYNNPELGRIVFLCNKPYLPKYMRSLSSETIQDALLVLAQNKKLNYTCYGPYDAGFEFTEKLFKNIAKCYSFVINTAPLRKNSNADGGSHWVVLYVDTETNEINFYDSKGNEPNNLVQQTISSIYKVLQKVYENLTHEIGFTRKSKQQGSYNCGIYVVHFVHQRLLGESFKKFSDAYIPDREIEKYRTIYWNEIP